MTYDPNELLKRMCEAWLLRKEYFGCGKQIIRGKRQSPEMSVSILELNMTPVSSKM